jgi:hypothetical protein
VVGVEHRDEVAAQAGVETESGTDVARTASAVATRDLRMGRAPWSGDEEVDESKYGSTERLVPDSVLLLVVERELLMEVPTEGLSVAGLSMAALIQLAMALQFAELSTTGFPLDSISSEALPTTALVSSPVLLVDPLVPEPSQALVVDLEPEPQYAKAFGGQLVALVQGDRHPQPQLQ